MFRFVTTSVILLLSVTALGHHSVMGIYDDQKRFIIEAEVTKFELINPHPLILIEITDIPGGDAVDGVSVGQTWTLEMDNKRELTALGINAETFVPGDKLLVAVDPSRHSLYRETTLYLRAVEHRRQGFVYLHNVRQLYPIEGEEENLSRHLHRVR
jgi:hypothetical protein